MLTCDLCGKPSNGYECDWQVEKFVSVRASSLAVGDTVRRREERQPPRSVAKVAFLKQLSASCIAITLAIQTPDSLRRSSGEKRLGPLELEADGAALLGAWRADRFRQIVVAAQGSIRALRMAACGARVCDACMVERDPNRMVICRSHWDAWEKVA